MATNKRTIQDIQNAIDLGKEIYWGPDVGKEAWEYDMTTKKEPTKYTETEMEEIRAQAFMDGMAAAHTLMYDAMDELKNSVDNVQSFFYLGNVTGKRTEIVEQLQLVWDSLTHLQDVVQDKYDTEIAKHKAVLRRHEYAELRDSLGL